MSRHPETWAWVVCGILIVVAWHGSAAAQPNSRKIRVKHPRPHSTSISLNHKYFHLAGETGSNPTEAPATETPSPQREAHHPGRVELGKEYFKSFLSDTYHILTSPMRWDTTDWIKASLILATTGGLITLDGEIQDFAQRNRTTTTDDIARIAEPFGNGLYLVSEMGIAYLVGSLIKNEKLRRASLLSFESFTITGMLVYGLKYLTGRDRPTQADGRYDWDGPNTRDISFSSGHTAAAFAVATTLAEEYRDSVWIPPLAFGIATFTGLSRINDNEHWASDVFLGAVIGYFTAKTIVKLHSEPESSRLIIYPSSNGRATTLNFTYLF